METDSKHQVSWPHAPVHRLAESGTYFITAGTYQKLHHFRGKERLEVLHRALLKVCYEYGWQLEAWAVFSNHYHFVAHSPEESASNLKIIIGTLHEKTAIWVNRLDASPRRQVWFNFRDTKLTYEKSYLARLNYVHQNPVKHGLVPVSNQYTWGSAVWFERTSPAAQVQTIYGFKTDSLRLYDEYDVAPEW